MENRWLEKALLFSHNGCQAKGRLMKDKKIKLAKEKAANSKKKN
jgi:hypothetical protein